MAKPLRVLVLEDSAVDAEVVIRELRRAGFDPDWKRVETKADFLAALDTSPELILSDYSLPHFDGVRAVQLLRERGLDIPFILISGTLGEEAAVEAMKLGVSDYLLKDRITRLGSAVERALEEKRQRDERRRAGEELGESQERLRLALEGALRLQHELGIHKIELEMQNDQLRAAQAEVETSLERFTELYDFAPVGYFNLARDGAIRQVNLTGARLVGTERGRLLGRRFVLRVVQHDRRAFHNLLQQVFAIGDAQSCELTLARDDGTTLDIHIEATRSPDGRECRAVLIDITERKQAEASLRESEARFRAMFEQAAVGVARITPEGRWLEVNQRLCDIVGYTREELLTKTFQDITHPDDLETDLGFVRQMLAGEIQNYAMEKRYWRKDGSLVWINLTVSLVRGPAGAPLYFISVIEDIHARKEAEAALRQLNAELEQRVAARTAELEEAYQELDSFSHSVSHDLRAPLRVISGFGQFLGEECAATLDERGRGHLRRIMDAAAQMRRLIDDLLQFAHASRAELRRRPVDLSALAQEVVRDLKQVAPERRVEFLCAPGLSVSGDARLLRVVLVNLLGNAWKYTGKAAEPRVEFGRLDADGETSFFIRDNGAGFDMRYAHRLFGAFQRLHSMSEFEGTGVGLATVQRIVHRHGGKIWAEARVNEGATFYVTLPTRKEVKP